MGGTRQPSLKGQIAAFANELGFDTVGFCSAEPPSGIDFFDQWLKEGKHGTMSYLARNRHLRADPQRLLERAKSVIAVTLNYNQPNPDKLGMPHIARYALGRDYHKVMRQKLKRLTEQIARIEPSAKFRICVDSAPVLEREFANRAGLGWFGKNTMLIDSKRGSWFFIGIVLTTLELESDKPTKGACGTCTKCIDACPTQAIVRHNGRWQVDARKCISYLTIEHKGPVETDLHGWTFGCDVCQEVCPFNAPNEKQPLRARTTTVEDFLAKREWPSLETLATIEEEDWDVLTRGSPVRRTGLVSLRRIAHVGLTKPRGKT